MYEPSPPPEVAERIATSRLWRRLLWLGLTVVIATWLFGLLRIRGEWSRAVAQADRWQVWLASRPTARPALGGAAHSGNAWDAYERALRHLEGLGDVDAALAKAEVGDADAARSKVRAAAAPALSELRHAALCGAAHLPIDFNRGYDLVLPNVLGLFSLAKLADAAAQQALCDGDVDGAVRLACATLQLGRDVMAVPTLVSAAVAELIVDRHVLDRLLVPDVLERFGVAGRARLRAAIDDALRHWPIAAAVAGEAVGVVRALERSPRAWAEVRWPGWRDLFSPRLACAGYALAISDLADALVAEGAAHLERARAAAQQVENPFRIVTAPGSGRSFDGVTGPREVVARLHAALAALAWFDGAEAADLTALGKLLRRRIEVNHTATGATFTSVGAQPDSVAVDLARAAIQPSR